MTARSVFPEDKKTKKPKSVLGNEFSTCYCGGKTNEWKIGSEVYLQCDRCQLRTPSYGDTEKGRDLLYHFWNNRPPIKGN